MSGMTEIVLTIQMSDGYRKALATVEGYEADSRKRATVEAIQDGLSAILAGFLDDTFIEYQDRTHHRGKGR